MKVHRKDFDNVTDMLRYAAQKPGDHVSGSGGSRTTDRDHDWDYKTGWRGALVLARNGWPEGVERVQAARELVKLPEAITTLVDKPVPVFCEEGDEVAVDRFLDGESDHWLTFPMQQVTGQGRVAKIRVNITASAAVPASLLEKKGAAVCMLVDALENAGIRCEIISEICAEASRHQILTTFRLKELSEALDMDRVAYWLAHPAAFRRIGFGLIERICPKEHWGHFSCGYGRPADHTAEQEDEIYFPCSMYANDVDEAIERSMQKAREWVIAATDEE
jgi:hypothetical protein